MKKIILTGGGTGGHVYPNIALIPDLQEAGFQVVYVGGKGNALEKRLCAELGIEYHGLPTVKLVRGLSLKGIVNNLKIPFVLMHSVTEGRKLLKALQPDLIFAKGGYVSLPMVLSHGKIPLICHESDLTLGL
ncbi:MAG: glycosyltransferase, partial [Clostridia bacterium]|nr:glycosyltransferase [Clostridia bacterium]